MSFPFSPAFVADSTGSIQVVRSDSPQNVDLGRTQPIDIPLDDYLATSTTDD